MTIIWAISTAVDVVEGSDPYITLLSWTGIAFGAGAIFIPYPLPIIVVGLPLLPFAVISLPLAVAIFVGASAAVLTYGVLQRGQPWRLLMFLSFPYACAWYYSQWSPLIMAAWFLPTLAPFLVLIKPQIALPVAINRLTFRGVAIGVVVVCATLVFDPTWPLRWLATIGTYERMIPALVLPFGPLLLLTLLRWRESAQDYYF